MIIRTLLHVNIVILLFFIAALLPLHNCYEKTLRKIVRSQSKMVQRPFSENNANDWKNVSHTVYHEFHPGHTQVNSAIHKRQRPKISTILSSIEIGKGRTLESRGNVVKHEHIHHYDLRTARDVITNEDFQIKDHLQDITDGTYINRRVHEIINSIPTSKFFFTNTIKDDASPTSDNIVYMSHDLTPDLENNVLSKTYVPTLGPAINVVRPDAPPPEGNTKHILAKEDNMHNDSTIQTTTAKLQCFNISELSLTCTVLNEAAADIDAQNKFAEFNIEPQWVTKGMFWNDMYESRYEALMRSHKWPSLKVILLPRSDIHSMWKPPFENLHNDTIRNIISNTVKKLNFYPNLTFSWNEVSHLSYWWKDSQKKKRNALRRLLDEGRLEFTTGGWVETDESTSHLFGIVHQLIEGHQWLYHNLNCTPQVAWLTASITHSPTFAYLLSLTGISHLVFTNLHHSWQQYLTEYQYTDFVWIQSWDNNKNSETILNKALHKIGNNRYPQHSILAHYLPYNSASFSACGPQASICETEFNFANINNNIDINTFNIKEKSEKLLEQYSKTGTTTTHNVIIAPIGGQFSYEFQTEFDYQYSNYQKILEFVNLNKDIYKATVEFGSVKEYFKSVLTNQKNFPTFKGDLYNFADIKDGHPVYQSGQFTVRPTLKIWLRRIQSTLRTTEILFSSALNFDVFNKYDVSNLIKILINARENVARLQDRNVVSGMLTAKALEYIRKQIILTAKDCWHIQETAASLLNGKPGRKETYLEKYIYRDGEIISSFKSVVSGDQIYIFNSLNHERTEIVELLSREPNLHILNHNKKKVIMQISPTWKVTTENKIRISRQFIKISFAVTIPPMAFQLFKIRKGYITALSMSTVYCMKCEVEDVVDVPDFPFTIYPIESGDIQLENHHYMLIFDEHSSLLKTVIEKATNKEKKVYIDFGEVKNVQVKADIFLFNINNKPDDVLLPYRNDPTLKITMIISGQLFTEMTTTYDSLLQHSVQIINLVNSSLSNVLKLNTKLDISPKNEDLELFLSIQTTIKNGLEPALYIDNNGFQHSHRMVNLSRGFESNVYPITSMAFIEDEKSRLTVVTDHSQGVTSLREGQITIILNRRVSCEDGRGSKEEMTEIMNAHQTHYILLENFEEPKVLNGENGPTTEMRLPSLLAIYLSNILTYQLDLYFVTQRDKCHYALLPLINTPLPCDVAILNYRVEVNNFSPKYPPDTALMILHRQSYSCSIQNNVKLHCSGDKITLSKVFRNIKSAFETNLVGTRNGPPVYVLSKTKFPPMELLALRVYL